MGRAAKLWYGTLSAVASPNKYCPLALALVCVAGAAHAQGVSEAEQKLAQSLFDHARQLIEAGQVPSACAKFAESQRLDPAGGTLLNLALCHEREGKVGSAWYEYNEALSLSLKENRQDREQIARERLAAIEPTLARLSVAPAKGADVEGLEVRLDGTLLNRAAWGTPAVVDPGPHGVDARAPGYEPWASSVRAEGSGQVTRVEVPGLARSPRANPAALRAAPYAETTISERNPQVYAYGATSIVGFTTFLIMAPAALIANAASDQDCHASFERCERDKRSAGSTATTFALVSAAGLGVGVIAGVAALSVPPTIKRKRVRVNAGLGAGGWGLGLAGAFLRPPFAPQPGGRRGRVRRGGGRLRRCRLRRRKGIRRAER